MNMGGAQSTGILIARITLNGNKLVAHRLSKEKSIDENESYSIKKGMSNPEETLEGFEKSE